MFRHVTVAAAAIALADSGTGLRSKVVEDLRRRTTVELQGVRHTAVEGLRFFGLGFRVLQVKLWRGVESNVET